jgi:5-methylcytosine-specific restriction endonuclease McrA
MIKRPTPRKKKLTRLEVFNRDKYTCQYCGKQTVELTLDHVIPRHSGGEHSWENVVSACITCNRRKAGHTLKEANMRLISDPQPPRHNGFHIPCQYLQTHQEWLKYIPGRNEALYR